MSPGQHLVYLDHHATTPMDPRVLERMLPYFCQRPGNPASLHAWGAEARRAVEEARQQVAALIGADDDEIVFTSGATEANNLALRGVMEAAGAGSRLITSAVEHDSILEVARHLEARGHAVSRLPVDGFARVDAEMINSAQAPSTTLVSVMLASNEVGTINPLLAIAAKARRIGALVHCDAAQAVGHIPVSVARLRLDLLSLSAHKFHGPKGVGALYVRRACRARIAPLQLGGGQEEGMRAGTLNVPGIVGLGAACVLAMQEMEEEADRISRLRDSLHQQLTSRLDGVELHGHPQQRLPQNLHLSFAGVSGEALTLAMPDLAASTGSACASRFARPSHVLLAMGVDTQTARTTVRFGLGRFTTAADIDSAAAQVEAAVIRLRALSCVDGREAPPPHQSAGLTPGSTKRA